MADDKKERGAFYTTNYARLLAGIERPPAGSRVVEPFAGAGHLLDWLSSAAASEAYDVAPGRADVARRDTLRDPPDYIGKYVVTNPPYLARNRMQKDDPNRQLCQQMGQDDLYKCFLSQLVRRPCEGGVLVLPVNFWSSYREGDRRLRERFLRLYRIDRMNLFETTQFDDTSYNVAAFSFSKRKEDDDEDWNVPCFLEGNDGEPFSLTLGPQERFSLLPSFPPSNVVVRRRRSDDEEDPPYLVLRCIDDPPGRGQRRRIGLELRDEPYADTSSSRAFATLAVEGRPPLSASEKAALRERFGALLEELRARHRGLFLANFREHGRKRIAFALAYKLAAHALETM